ncbi:uncharacterized protein A1O5_00070 [Cladophialophora psammophila CBS 110553]|uniref:Uncharacterized protein n=1 Tax=Cladophialophora psammophila CBS 110553 TaxID=1182543 RepID=W9XZ73_9EURO|nr:uncharacterized protein A1O5_00070 [Cladophialophora psammophila CBS 110553]EXJ75564.1 hypothetical protein A1O5_00070 [Cladophialophora psammophila CBS 110553]
MDVPKFKEREKALEDDYIRRKEAEKFKPPAPTQPGSTQPSNPEHKVQPKKQTS